MDWNILHAEERKELLFILQSLVGEKPVAERTAKKGVESVSTPSGDQKIWFLSLSHTHIPTVLLSAGLLLAHWTTSSSSSGLWFSSCSNTTKDCGGFILPRS